ncbi:RelA/SpoT domain-containing protein [Dickeya dadantii]|uniref:RelA/SpoT domain-containing protein n=1 Tax=Dickeya dadantii TaxID=204038 RepID=UPI001495C3D7|nr:RelA/SpoT domain-containing protein [Dickeya dadantii]NPE57666.1 RelA/SpoT domain-containing protein [Dickeya dadantii]NPE71948.1 RelA/SpoT domain-containing protein [Dickeya dadantii]
MINNDYYNDEVIDLAVGEMEVNQHKYGLLQDKIISLITRDENLKKVVHSYKYRFKDKSHLRDKIIRKNDEDFSLPEGDRKGPITSDNVKKRITDYSGVRIIHLYQEQFRVIHGVFNELFEQGELFKYEEPKAYTWDPEYQPFFEELGLESVLRQSLYTSVHYVVKPREDSDITCEIQVRTLFEEAWGEIDHALNYPIKTDKLVIQEQLKVLARVVGAGSRLADSIFKLSE